MGSLSEVMEDLLNERAEEIKAMDWREIRDLAETLGVEKPSDKTWVEMALQIAEAEGELNLSTEVEDEPTEVQSAGDVEASQDLDETLILSEVQPEVPLESASTVEPVAEPVYPTRHYASLGIPVCGSCGAKKQLNRHRQPICAAGRSDCKFVNRV